MCNSSCFLFLFFVTITINVGWTNKIQTIEEVSQKFIDSPSQCPNAIKAEPQTNGEKDVVVKSDQGCFKLQDACVRYCVNVKDMNSKKNDSCDSGCGSTDTVLRKVCWDTIVKRQKPCKDNRCQMDVTFVVDHSGSLRQKQKDAYGFYGDLAQYLLENLKSTLDAQIAVVEHAKSKEDPVRVTRYFTPKWSHIRNTLKQLPEIKDGFLDDFVGSLQTVDRMYERGRGDKDVCRAMVTFTDGTDPFNVQAIADAAHAVRTGHHPVDTHVVYFPHPDSYWRNNGISNAKAMAGSEQRLHNSTNTNGKAVALTLSQFCKSGCKYPPSSRKRSRTVVCDQEDRPLPNNRRDKRQAAEQPISVNNDDQTATSGQRRPVAATSGRRRALGAGLRRRAANGDSNDTTCTPPPNDEHLRSLNG